MSSTLLWLLATDRSAADRRYKLYGGDQGVLLINYRRGASVMTVPDYGGLLLEAGESTNHELSQRHSLSSGRDFALAILPPMPNEAGSTTFVEFRSRAARHFHV